MRLGVDVGATGIKTGFVTEDGQLLCKETSPTQTDKGKETVLRNLEAACRVQMERRAVSEIGIGIPGRVDTQRGVLITATNLPIKNFPVASYLQEALGVPVYLGNDANCALIGEMYFGEGAQSEFDDINMLMVTVGTGIGGATAIGGRIYRGRYGNASEFGHTTICNTGEVCRCGRVGCFEQYASVTALIRQTLAAAAAQPDSLLAHTVRQQNGKIDGKTVFEAAKNGCDTAQAVIERYAKYLADGINNLNTIFRPDRLVLAGEIFHQGEFLFSRITPHCYDPRVLRVSALHDRAGILGAAMLGEYARTK